MAFTLCVPYLSFVWKVVALQLDHISHASPALVSLACQNKSGWSELTGLQKLLSGFTAVCPLQLPLDQTSERLTHLHHYCRLLVLWVQ